MKKARNILIILIILVLFSSYSSAEGDKVYVVPIKGEINRANSNYVRTTIEKVNKEGAKGIIFEIDTYGGLINEAINIKDAIIATDIPTISFVNNKAESAGVLISIASENLVMSPNATIGSAETIPNTEKELSLWRAVLRDTAQYRGRNSEIIEAMADKDIEIPGISPKGKLVNLTSKEALEVEIADYLSNDYDDILAEFGFAKGSIVEEKESIQLRLARYISNPYISSLILTLAFVGMIIEIFTPGFGLGGTISIIGFGLYFGGNILAGHSHWTSLALFVTGLILLVVEGIVPGFGLPGISGIILVLVGIILAMDSLGIALLSMSIAVIITSIVTIVLVKYGFRSKVLDHIILETEELDRDKYVSSDSKDRMLNKEGVSLTPLRPSGFIEIDGEKLDALSDEGYIPKDTMVRIIRVEGAKIFVRRM